MSKDNYKVYVHINKINGKRYFGITKLKVGRRWKNGKGYSHNEYFYRAINKYGWDNFEHIVIARGLTEEEAKFLEVELIREWDTTNREYGYNITKGGEGTNGYKHTEEERQRRSEVSKKQVYIIELDMTFDSITKCAEFLDCSRESISNVLHGKTNICKGYHIIFAKDKDNKELINKIMNPNYDKDIDKIMKPNYNKRYINKSKKQVYIIELDMTFDSITKCAEFLDCKTINVSDVLHGWSETCKGYHIILAKDKDKIAS